MSGAVEECVVVGNPQAGSRTYPAAERPAGKIVGAVADSESKAAIGEVDLADHRPASLARGRPDAGRAHGADARRDTVVDRNGKSVVAGRRSVPAPTHSPS